MKVQLNLQKENDTYKIDLEKKNTYINSLNQEISILKQYIDKQENKKRKKKTKKIKILMIKHLIQKQLLKLPPLHLVRPPPLEKKLQILKMKL